VVFEVSFEVTEFFTERIITESGKDDGDSEDDDGDEGHGVVSSSRGVEGIFSTDCYFWSGGVVAASSKISRSSVILPRISWRLAQARITSIDHFVGALFLTLTARDGERSFFMGVLVIGYRLHRGGCRVFFLTGVF